MTSMILPEYKKHKDFDKRIKSAYLAISEILKLDLYFSHKKELLSTCIWKITEANGKYSTRFISEKALEQIKNKSNIQHEHVFERKYLIEKLLETPSLSEETLNNAIACLVTKDEHKLLTNISKNNLQGWDRYIEANIKVYDLINQCEYKFAN